MKKAIKQTLTGLIAIASLTSVAMLWGIASIFIVRVYQFFKN